MFFYKIITRTYFLAIKLAAVFSEKAAKMIKGRRNLFTLLRQNIDENSQYIWFHCASLGEFEQGRPLIEEIKKKIESETLNYKILVTFFSPSGYEIRKNYKYADYVSYIPFDTPSNAKKFIDIVNPVAAIFVKYEIWHYFLKEIKNRNIPAYLISAIFRENQIFFKFYGKFYLQTLKNFKTIFVQNELSEELLKKHGINNTLVAGDTRIDRVIDVSRETYNNKILEKYCTGKKCLVFGSTWRADEKFILEFINKHKDEFSYIIAPHEVNEENILFLEKNIKLATGRLSKLNTVENLPDVIIIDSIGILSKVYRYASLAYVGGGFGKGIHNVLEPAVYGIPVVFGPNHKKFFEAIQLLELGVAFSFNSYLELENIINNTIYDSQKLLNISNFSKMYFSQNAQSTLKILNKISLM